MSEFLRSLDWVHWHLIGLAAWLVFMWARRDNRACEEFNEERRQKLIALGGTPWRGIVIPPARPRPPNRPESGQATEKAEA